MEEATVRRRPEGELPWTILVTDRRLEPQAKPSDCVVPEWALVEFFDTILLEPSVHRALSAMVGPHMEGARYDERSALYLWPWKSPRGQHTPETESGEESLRHMTNSPDSPPEAVPVHVKGPCHLLQLAEIAYADVEIHPHQAIGGRNALLLLSLEASREFSRQTMTGTFTFYNATALNLRHSRLPHSLANLILTGQVELLQAIAEPSHEGRIP